MKTGLAPSARFSFECGYHKVALDGYPDMEPRLMPLYVAIDNPGSPSISPVMAGGGDAARARLSGAYALDLGDMTCPATGPSNADGTYAEGEETLDWCGEHWRTWVED